MNKNTGSVGLNFLVTMIVLLCIVLPTIIGLVGWHTNTGSGTHVGYITAVEKSGLVFKTGTAYVKTDVQSSQEDAYCVIDDAVMSQLKDLAEKRVKVEVSYFSWVSAGVTNCEGERAIISAVREI